MRRSGSRPCSSRCSSRSSRCSTRSTPVSTSTRSRRARRSRGWRRGTELGVLLITHYNRLLTELRPDRVHVLMAGGSCSPAAPSSPTRSRRGLRGPRRRARCRGRGGGGVMSGSDPGSGRRGKIREGLPDPQRVINGHPLVYLDSAATSQKPRAGDRRRLGLLLEPQRERASRGSTRSARSPPRRFEGARTKLGGLLRQHPIPETIVFTRGTTEGMNLVAHGVGRGHSSARATRCCSPRWNTTRTSCPGS